MGERFAVVSEEDINLLVEKAVPENTKKSTSYAVNIFDGKLLVNVSFNCQHKSLQKVMISSKFRVFVDRLADPARDCAKNI